MPTNNPLSSWRSPSITWNAQQGLYKEKEPEIVFFDKDPIAYAVSMYENKPTDDQIYLLEYFSYAEKECVNSIVADMFRTLGGRGHPKWANGRVDEIGRICGRPVLRKPKITSECLAKAEEIRTHYKGKFLMMALKGNELTEFRFKVLNYFKLDDYRMVDRNLLGMLSKLPRMFDEDKILEGIKEEFSVGTFSETELKSCSEFKTFKTLTLIASHNKSNARHNGVRGEYTCYWFYDENNRVHLIELDIDNPFQKYWTKMIQNPIDIKSQSYPHNKRDNMNYFVANKWELFE